MATSIYDIFTNPDKRQDAKDTVKDLGRTAMGIALPIAGVAYGMKLNKTDINKYLFDARNNRGELTRQAGRRIRDAVLNVYQPNADALIDRAAKMGQNKLNILSGNDPLADMLGTKTNGIEEIKKVKEETMAILQTMRTRAQDLIPEGGQAGNQLNEMINQLDGAINNIDILFEQVQNKNLSGSKAARDLYENTTSRIVEFAKSYGNTDRQRNASFGNTFKQYNRVSENFFSDYKRKSLQAGSHNLINLNVSKTDFGLTSMTSHNIYGSGSTGNFIQNHNVFSQDFADIDGVINALHVKHSGLSSTGQLKTITNNIRNRFNDLSKIIHGAGRFQIVQEFQDANKVVSSVYYLPKFGNKEVPIALHLAKDAKTNVSYYRSTGQMGARYAMPNTFYSAVDLQNVMRMSSQKEQVQELQRLRSKGSFEDFQIAFFKQIHTQKNVGGQLTTGSLTSEEVNEILDMFRSTGVTSERRTSDIISNNTKHFNKHLMTNLRNAEAIQANRPIIYNMNKLPNRIDRTNFLSQLVSSNLGFEGVIGASTQTTDLEMKALGGMFSYGSAGVRHELGLDKAGNIVKELAFNPLNAIQSMGVMNRAVQPLVAREHQYHGKKELVMGFTNKTGNADIAKDIYDVERKTFGRFSQVKGFATGSDLIGVSSNEIGRQMVGVNVQGLLLVDDDLALNIGGFGEGAGLYGGRPIVRQAKDKTIIQTDYTPTTALTEYIAQKQQTASGDLFLGSKGEIQDFFEKFGTLLGEGDAGSMVDIKRLSSMHQLTIKLGEATPDLSRHKMSFVLESVNVEGGPKLFGPMVKHTGSSMPMLTSEIAENIIGRVMMSGKEFDDLKLEDLYMNQKSYEQDLDSKSRQLFGKDYASLSNEEKKQVETKTKVQKITQREIEKNFGIKYENTILTDYGQAKKSVYHSTTSAMGGLMSLGYSRSEFEKAGMFKDVIDPISGKTISEISQMDTFDINSLNKYAEHQFGTGKTYDALSASEQEQIQKIFKDMQSEDFSNRTAVGHFVDKSFEVIRNNMNKKVYSYKKFEVIANDMQEAQKLLFNQISNVSNFKDIKDSSGNITMTKVQQKANLQNMLNTANAIVEKGNYKPSAFSVGLVFGGLRYMTEKKGKFGFEKGSKDFESMLTKFSQGIYSADEQQTMLRAARLGVTVNASFAQIGPVASVLGNNLAAIEPRISNFYLNRLVTEFGMNADEATSNLGSLLVRQKGFGEKLALMEQMRLTTLSMSPLADNIKYEAEVEELLKAPGRGGKTQLQRLTKDEISQLKSLAAQQDNTGLKNFLSSFDVQKGVVINTEDLVQNKSVRGQLEKIIGGKKSIILPAGKPIEFLSSTSIKKSAGAAGGDEIIENDVLRLINDTFLHIGTAEHRRDPTYLLGRGADDESGRIRVYMGKLQEKFGNLTRNLNTLDIQGSSTIEGAGITLGADEGHLTYYKRGNSGYVTSTSFVHKDAEMNRIQISRMQKAYDKSKGFTGFMDTQAYVNTLTDFMGGIRSDTQWRVDQGYLSDSEKRYFDKLSKAGRSKKDIVEKMSNKFYRESISNFLLGMEEGVEYDKTSGFKTVFNPEGVTGTSIRNPALSPGNVNIGMQMFRMIDDSVTDTVSGDYALNKVMQRRKESSVMLSDISHFVRSKDFIDNLQKMAGSDVVFQKLGLDIKDPTKFKFTNFNQLKILNDLGNLDEFQNKNVSMSVIDEETGKIKTEIVTDKSGKQITKSVRKERKLKTAVADVLNEYITTLREDSGVGGGKMYFVNQNVDLEYEYKEGDQVKKASIKNKRVDFSRYGIGDYDGDIYAWINSTNNQLKKKLYDSAEGDAIISKMHKYGTEFLMYFDLLGEGMDSLAKSFGTFDKNIKFLQKDDQLKEQLIKSVGGLDVAVKTVIMGNLNQIREYQHAGRGSSQFDDAIKRNMSSMALLSTSVEILNIKAKKLPKSSNITDLLKGAIKSDLEQNSIENTKRFFKGFFQGTKFEKEIKITKFNILNAPQTSTGVNIHKNAAEGLTFSLDDAIAGMFEGIQAVKRGNLEYLSSNKRSEGLMSSIDELADTDAFQKAMSPMTTETLEAALINGTRQGDVGLVEDWIDDLGEQLERQHFAMNNLSMKANKNSMYAIGGGILGAGYLLGPSIDTSPLEGPGQFSDYKVNKRIAEGTLYEQMKGHDRDVAVGQVPTISRDVVMNRQVNYNEAYMTQNNNYLMFGELNTIKSLPSAASMIARNGGNASIRISDNRLPITGSYVDKLLGER
jgi:hypothetical protein